MAIRSDPDRSAPADGTGRLRYEVVARVPGEERPSFDRWLSAAVLDWATHPAVDGFRSWRGVDGDGVLLKLTFAVPGRAAWERFVGGGHRERLSTLEAFSEELHVALWAPAAVSVHADDEALRPLLDESDQAGTDLA